MDWEQRKEGQFIELDRCESGIESKSGRYPFDSSIDFLSGSSLKRGGRPKEKGVSIGGKEGELERNSRFL